MPSLVDMRMRLTGQNGVSDDDLGFTNFLSTFETSAINMAHYRKAGLVPSGVKHWPVGRLGFPPDTAVESSPDF